MRRQYYSASRASAELGRIDTIIFGHVTAMLPLLEGQPSREIARMTTATTGMMPSHPGAFVWEKVMEPLGLTISRAAVVLSVRRVTLSDFLNQKTGLAPEMALRMKKTFDVSMDFMHRMEAPHDAAEMRRQAAGGVVEKFQPGCV